MVRIGGVEFDEPPDDPYADSDRWEWLDYGDRQIPAFHVSSGFKCTVDGCQRILDDEQGFKHHVAQKHGLYRTVTLKCPHCGDEFEVEPSDADRRKFCSQECRHNEDRNRVLLTCETCGDLYEVVKSKASKRHHCSRECYEEARGGRPAEIIECATCGDEFEAKPSNDRTYCSQECFQQRNMEEFYDDD